ncbi:glycosyltransferase family A protein [Thioalkalivibrio nitratireducens]|uniref:glycosyltransferase family A protein n=1 Tax=Thioalkalivibrio nitratireducens TaxID=186931 RepID=UPI0005C1C1FC|nr:glycosyltransferase family A protein [Thioalkalivibrio nitratireducens]
MTRASGGTVDVLVRSMGRPSLVRAIESVRAQEGVSCRAIILAAHGQPIPAGLLPAGAPWVQVLAPERPLGRAAAANRLLDAAQAEFALFLDDDDWLLPGHLQRLAEALARHPGAIAAHAGVRCVADAEGTERLCRVYDADLDRNLMQLENQLPIHSTLFRVESQRADPAVRFDETLDHFEDWDFWLQLLQRGDFVRVPGVSAVYVLDAERGSGHADTADPERRRRLAAFGRRQLARWQGEDVADLIETMAAQRVRLGDLEQRLDQERARGEGLERQLTGEQKRVAEAAQQLTEAHNAARRLEEQRRTLQAEIDGERRTAETVRAQLEAERSENRALAAEMHAQRREAEHLAVVRRNLLRQVEGLNAHIAGIHQSRSWRLTRPLRAGRRLVGWVGEGGVGVLWNNAWLASRSELRRHGWTGVFRRSPFYLRNLRRLTAVMAFRNRASGDNPFMGAAPAVPGPVRLHPDLLQSVEPIEQRVSVVIPTFNAGAEFALLLRKLKAQRDVREVEIVVVDSGSTDGTAERARAAGARVVAIRQEEFSHSRARNLGARAATGDLLLFMVQDAYPVGDRWIHGMARWLADHAAEGVAAASCSEYSRSDSDLMYDSMIATHYRFLGCSEGDRIGRFTGSDHLALRTQGQLSDVACMIGRELFLRYEYRGDYAEDLDLGIRLIRAGHAVAMLASIKVIHSHNRAPWYYLKRTFVDVVFLVQVFEDFEILRCPSASAMLAAVERAAAVLGRWLEATVEPRVTWSIAGFKPRELLRSGAVAAEGAGTGIGDASVDRFLQTLRESREALPPAAGVHEPFTEMLLGRLDHVQQFALSIHPSEDGRVRTEFVEAVRKTFAGTVGAALAYLYLDRRDAAPDDVDRRWVDGLYLQLKSGV